ncbi:SDR family oxidoreductase [Xanthomonas dyei]|uniref:Oxidoreductase n=1 Tax=Xanthomonas dyei TaxID=743699 RepID=A0A2S7BZ02_9XANT|nr:SDR family oxidoreductase [Xanthomonas dyei]PPU54548.1 oxidoreductase [Xanthomonas dyei]
MSSGIQGKVVVITGASSGIGEATARHLAAHGAKVVLGARRAERLNSLVAEIVDAGGDAVAIATDVTRAEEVTRLVDTAAETFSRVDVLINNAGVMPLSNLESLKVAEWNQMIDVNIKGVLHGIAAVIPQTKFAVRAICEGLRQEVKAYNIRTTILSPGAVKTELLDHISDEAVKSTNSDYVAKVGIPADSYARMAAFAISQPDDVDVNEIIFRPTAQTL